MSYNILPVKSEIDVNSIPDLSGGIKVALNLLVKEPLEELYFAEVPNYISPYCILAVSVSPRQIDAIINNIIKTLKEENLFTTKIKIDGNGEREWCIIDIINCFIHIMTPTKLQKYDLQEIFKGNYQEPTDLL